MLLALQKSLVHDQKIGLAEVSICIRKQNLHYERFTKREKNNIRKYAA
jgi:hypothetical protein